MAIGKYSAVPPPPEMAQGSAPSQPPPHASASASGTGGLDIEAWTVSALQSLSVSPAAPGTGGQPPLSIPLDDDDSSSPPHGAGRPHATTRVTIALSEGVVLGPGITPPRRPPSRRDSMKRREALLKGKEGSRQRRRWDMARLTDVPNVEPPSASDWEPRPVYPIQHIPYHVAQYWDRGLRQQVEDKRNNTAARKQKGGAAAAADNGTRGGKVPRDLRETVKKTPGVKGWVRTLEEPVRQFLVERGAHVTRADPPPASKEEEHRDDDDEESDFSDEEIVFVGRSKKTEAATGTSHTQQQEPAWKKAHRQVGEQQVDRGMIFDSLEEDESGAFKRWLTHSISDYYGLDSRSVTMGNPARRCVYIGIREGDLRKGTRTCGELPRPLWELFR